MFLAVLTEPETGEIDYFGPFETYDQAEEWGAHAEIARQTPTARVEPLRPTSDL